MNLLAWLNPYRWLLAAGLIAAVVLGVPILKHRYDAGQQDIGYQKRAAEDKAAADAQTTRNRELQRAAELRYVVKGETQDHFFTTTITEIRHDAAPLAACPVPEPVRVRLNAAAACARGDSASSCGPAEEVPSP